MVGQALDDRAEQEGGEEGQRADQHDHADQQDHERRVVGSHGVTFADLLGGFDMVFARYAPILFALAVAGALAGKRVTPAGLGTMRTDNTTFAVLLIGVIVLVGALTFFPALLLGPIVQGLTGHLY